MKDFIVIAAILPLLLLFMMQFAADCQRNEKLEIIQNIVYTAKETAKQEGAFSRELQESVITQISERLGIPRHDISISATEGKKDRYSSDRLIEYRVSVKLTGIMSGGRMMGIDDDENVCTYVIDSFTASEYLQEL